MALSSKNGSRQSFDQSDSRLRLQTIVRLRWFAVAGQTIAVAVVALWFRFPMPIGICLVCITLSAWLNVFLRVRHPARHRLSAAYATGLLSYDLLQLAALIYLTGGIQNPFIVLIVAPVTVSAATLPARNTIALGTLAVVVAALLVEFHLPLPWGEGHPLAGQIALPLLYELGMLVAVIATLIFLALYAWRLSKEARQMTAALAATELALAHEQKLHALDGLAAAAAHELGTPLATIALVTRELERQLPTDDPNREDIELLRTQALRCRDILQKLTRSPSEQDPMHATMSIAQLLEETVEPYLDHRVEIEIDATAALSNGSLLETNPPGSGKEPVGERRPGVIYGLGNIMENAVDFAKSKVEIKARWSAQEVVITVYDDGPGFSPEILDTIGEPYVTSRPAGRSSQPAQPRQGGLGLGFFIAKTLLERSGATLTFGNRSDPQQGAYVRIWWSREAFEAQSDPWALPNAGQATLSP